MTSSASTSKIAAVQLGISTSVLITEVEVLDCTAAIYDADTEEVTVQWHGTSDELADLLDRLAK